MAPQAHTRLVVIATHPVQYHAPVYRALSNKFGIPLSVIYGSDSSVRGYKDEEFQVTLAWDTDLLSGYNHIFLSAGRRLGTVLRELSPEIVLIQGYGSLFHWNAFYHAQLAGYPVIFRAETTDQARHRGAIKNFCRDRILRFLYGRCARLLYIGRNSYSHFKKIGCPEEKLIFSPYCVDAGGFNTEESVRMSIRQKMRDELGVSENEIVLLFCGKLVSRKGPDLLVKAVKKLPAALRSRFVLLFVGDGAMRKRLNALAKEDPGLKAVFAGFVNQSAISGYYHASDMLILPSLHSETWGLVVNEALHHGLPCVVSEAVGSAPDLIEPGLTGEVFKTGSVEDLAKALNTALKLIVGPGTRKACMSKVCGYTVDKAAEGIARAYRSVTGDGT